LISKSYLFAGFFAGAFFAGALAAGLFAVCEFAIGAFAGGVLPGGIRMFAPVSVGIAILAFASAVFALASAVFEFVEAGASGLLFNTEILPVNAGIARKRAESMKVAAAVIVTLDKTVAVPRGAKAELDTLLVNNAPASVLPGCSNTAAISTRHERKNIPYKK